MFHSSIKIGVNIMIKSIRQILLITLSLLILTTLISYDNKENSKSTFGINQFTKQMKSKNYTFKLKDVQKDFLPTTRKMMVIDKDTIFIYLYNNDKEAAADSKRIDIMGCSYQNGGKSVQVSWISFPHFYRKGSIIVQYVGINEKIISDLKDILGKQFAGYK